MASRNVEIKARLHSLQRFEETKMFASVIADQKDPCAVLQQTDIFYNCQNGRLKLRSFGPRADSELISYNRPDMEGPKTSTFFRSSVKDADTLHAALNQALGTKSVVKKTRYLYMVGQTRIHLDYVVDLGYFMELEVCLTKEQTEAEGKTILEDIMQKLFISQKDLVEGAYEDLLALVKKKPTT